MKMFDFDDSIWFIVVVIVFVLCTYSIVLNIYFIKRYSYKVKVNCWFCNKNSYVLYRNRNKFICKFCEQYNGFDKDGNYNKQIPAQHVAMLNKSYYAVINDNKKKQQHSSSSASSTPKMSATLCNSCNRNQELKIKQLAQYEPLNPDKYDVEIEHFLKQLERSYALCKQCKKVVKNTIQDQDTWMFGNRLKSFKNKTQSYFTTKLNNANIKGTIAKSSGFYFSFNLILFILSMLSLLIFSRRMFVLLPPYWMENLLKLKTAILSSTLYTGISRYAINYGIKELFSYRSLVTVVNVNLATNILGLCIELVFSLVASQYTLKEKFSKLLSWLVLCLIFKVPVRHTTQLYIDTLYIFCCFWLLFSYSLAHVNWSQRTKMATGQKSKSFNKRQVFSSDDDSDVDDDDGHRNESEQERHYRSDSQSTIHNNGFESFSSRPNNHNNNKVNNDLNKDFHRLNIIESNNGQFVTNSFSSPSSPLSSFRPGSSLSSNHRFNSLSNLNCSYYPPMNLYKKPLSLLKENHTSSFSMSQGINLCCRDQLLNRSKVDLSSACAAGAQSAFVCYSTNHLPSMMNSSKLIGSTPPSVGGSERGCASRFNVILPPKLQFMNSYTKMDEEGKQQPILSNSNLLKENNQKCFVNTSYPIDLSTDKENIQVIYY